ncbi:MAG TPA: ATP-binding cassette domain-containing protein [Patescibacteria group bacterium]|nr:ATP-binding cassette domain-containing protein [Patescibacteria group bacterium]
MIKLDNVSKKFGTGVFGLSDITIDVDKGEFLFLVGPSGSGKTTIFRLLIRDTLPTEGTIVIEDWDVVKLPKSQIPHLRKKIGVVFQDLKLLMDRTVFENIMLPLEVVGIKIEEASQKAEDVLAQVGLLEHKEKFPIQLSGGELQRAAIARALVLSPDIILADEATGNLDMATSWEIIKLLSDINEKGTTVVMATHNLDIVKNLSKRVIELEKGRITKDSKSPKSEQKKNGGKDIDKEEQKKDKKEEEKPVDKDKEDKSEDKKEEKK